jgi:hypothetical protein
MQLRPVVLACVVVLLGCSSGSSGSEAQRHGVGAACKSNTDCTESGQVCLPFKGGYCGVANCTKDADCPGGSACVAHSDGKNYCFLICIDKPACNLGRPVDAESNCSSSVTFVGGTKGAKACVPPS